MTKRRPVFSENTNSSSIVYLYTLACNISSEADPEMSFS
jgi:hypothetical protein